MTMSEDEKRGLLQASPIPWFFHVNYSLEVIAFDSANRHFSKSIFCSRKSRAGRRASHNGSRERSVRWHSGQLGSRTSFDKSISSSLSEYSSDFRMIAWYSPSLFVMPFITLFMRMPMSWYNAESFPIQSSFRGVWWYLWIGWIASWK